MEFTEQKSNFTLFRTLHSNTALYSIRSIFHFRNIIRNYYQNLMTTESVSGRGKGLLKHIVAHNVYKYARRDTCIGKDDSSK